MWHSAVLMVFAAVVKSSVAVSPICKLGAWFVLYIRWFKVFPQSWSDQQATTGPTRDVHGTWKL